jgi:hypothetical protein
MNQLDLAQGGCNGGARAVRTSARISISYLVEYKAEKEERERGEVLAKTTETPT